MKKILLLSLVLAFTTEITLQAQGTSDNVPIKIEKFASLGSITNDSNSLRDNLPRNRWGLRMSDYPLPSFEVGVRAAVSRPTQFSTRSVGTYSLEIGLTPWQFQCAPRKYSVFHGGWGVGVYSDFSPQEVTKQIEWEQDPIDPNAFHGSVVERDPAWGYQYEIGAFTRFMLAWTFLPKRPDSGQWTLGIAPEFRHGFLNQGDLMSKFDPHAGYYQGHWANFQVGLNGFVQYRKNNWSVKGQVGMGYSFMNGINLNAGLSVGYHF